MFTTLLTIHILNGGIALLAGAGALGSRKGGTLHRKAGQLFFWAMVAVLVTAVLLALYKTNVFLLCIAVFSFHLAYTGYRAAHYSRQSGYHPTLPDRLVLWGTLAVSVVMVGLGLMPLLRGQPGLHLVLVVFGGILFANCLLDLRLLLRGTTLPNRAFLLSHIGRMSGAYIATCTAFLVTNVHFEPAWVVWLLPTVTGTPFIALSMRSWRKKLRLDKSSVKKTETTEVAAG